MLVRSAGLCVDSWGAGRRAQTQLQFGCVLVEAGLRPAAVQPVARRFWTRHRVVGLKHYGLRIFPASKFAEVLSRVTFNSVANFRRRLCQPRWRSGLTISRSPPRVVSAR